MFKKSLSVLLCFALFGSASPLFGMDFSGAEPRESHQGYHGAASFSASEVSHYQQLQMEAESQGLLSLEGGEGNDGLAAVGAVFLVLILLAAVAGAGAA